MGFYFFYKGFSRFFQNLLRLINRVQTFFIFKGNRVKHNTFRTCGNPYVVVARGGKLSIGKSFHMNNGIRGNPIGIYDKCTFFVDNQAVMTIGDNVGMSQSALICHEKITIGNYVKIGGGVKIYDTDFHSLDPMKRASKNDQFHKAKAAVVIKDNAFLGACSMILKGVTVGENSIVGAGSIVTKDIPDNQIWAGNPAKFIKNI
ncbi:acyltransferase [Zunongwangia sp. SCSIO 43204]|uniref:acyltransferase n=1 Tax=Zunongwangia sp. SCSIO 43204 TaxID=2779359 RepID=UPI001CA9B8C6|nr:acyltransferase [Zunongwangia sp. SCSIO 43204]UAB84825.1 acyltransferase [Zunongwangia sp. SCSIO 43204]